MKKVLAHTLIAIKFFYNSFTPPPLPHVNVTWLWCRHQKLVTTRLHCLGEQRWVEKLIRQELQDFYLLCLMEGCQPLFKGKCAKYFCLWLLISSKKISAYICTYTVCKWQIWFIICHTEERTLWCLQLDLSRKISITTSTWILHRQNECCLHSFWNVTFTNVSEIEMKTILSQLFPSIIMKRAKTKQTTLCLLEISLFLDFFQKCKFSLSQSESPGLFLVLW